mgnify:CR=1 FL=1
MIVVKMGGSLYNTPELHHWLKVLAAYSARQSVVIVPGGGPFADQVRAAQKVYHFDDETAHHMAIVAMKQFGLLLSALSPNSQIITGKDIPNSPFSIYLADDELLSEASLLKSWDISSDSIALWLANILNAEKLLLIKRVAVKTNSISELTENDIIDKGFADLFSQSTVNTNIIHYQAYARLLDYTSKTGNKLSLQLP